MKTFLKIVGGIFAFVFCLTILFVELVGHSIFGLNSLLSEKRINRIVDSTNISYLLEDEGGNKTTFYKKIAKATRELNLTEQEISNLVNSNGFKNILNNLILGMKEKYIYDSKEQALYEMEIVNLVSLNIDNMIANVNREISPEDRNNLIDMTTSVLIDMVDGLPSFSNAREDYPQLKYLNQIFSLKVKLAIVGAVILLTLLIILSTWSFSKGLKLSGAITMAVSLLVIIVGIATSYVLSYILYNIPIIGDYASLSKSVLKEVGLVFISDGFITLGASIIMLIIANILAKRAERKEEQGTILAN